MVSSERVLVTGANSFTGKPLVQALRHDGHEVVTVGGRHGDVDFRADLRDPDEIIDVVAQVKPTAIVHMAAITFAPDQHFHQIYTTNVSGTASLLKGAKTFCSELKIVLLPSAAKIYAEPDTNRPIDEDSPLAPPDHYSVSKLAMEKMAGLFGKELPITITRPFNYTGPGQASKFFVPKLVTAFVAGQDVRIGNLQVWRDFSDIDIVVETYRRLIARPQPGRIFNICSGKPVQLNSIAEMLREITGNDISLTVDPAFVRAGEPEFIVGSRQRLEEAIGRLPETDIKATLARMVAHASTH